LFVLIFSATALLLIGTGRYIISDAFVVNLFAKIIEIVIIVAPFAVGFCLVAELAYFEVFIERDKPKYATRMIILTAITVIALIGCFYGWSTL
jgi:hypothetical protein